MSFILSADSASPEATREGFRRYSEYLTANRDRFPPSAYGLATSPWFYDPTDHRSPHDAWLESVSISEPSSGERHEHRAVSIRVRLLGAYHDGHIELYYSRVSRYRLELHHNESGHRDWRFDEFRLSDRGHLVHLIEWHHLGEVAQWMIESTDVIFSWHPFDVNAHKPFTLTVG